MIPLAERMRPKTLPEYVGQRHLIGEGAVLQRALANGRLPSCILWGPPGVGKTTLANLLATQLGKPFFSLSAIAAGVKDVRDVIEQARNKHLFVQETPVLFIDEIHRFNKAQQDSLLGAVEKGVITLIGATTENPSFEVIPALLSRCQVHILQELSKEELIQIVQNAIDKDDWLQNRQLDIQEYEFLLRLSGGDARKLLNCLELLADTADGSTPFLVNNETVQIALPTLIAAHDKDGEQHYNLISAFIKSIRGSDPNASVYWLARMLNGGEDVNFIARRLLILAAEDVGLANPNALLMAQSTLAACHQIGMPEARILLSQCTLYLATSPKSNASYMAIEAALVEVQNSGNLSVPLPLRNSPTKLMKALGYGDAYQYSHDYPGNFVEQQFQPDALAHKVYYKPGNNVQEQKILERLRIWWNKRYYK